MKHAGLPPLVAEIRDGAVTWQRLENLDYELLGYFLSCHLIIEHYLDEYLKTCYPKLDWDASKQTFGQKVALLATDNYPDKYNSIPAIKHLNSLRNKLSHNIDFKISGIRKSVWAPEDQVMTTFTRKIAKACCTSGSDGVEFNCRES